MTRTTVLGLLAAVLMIGAGCAVDSSATERSSADRQPAHSQQKQKREKDRERPQGGRDQESQADEPQQRPSARRHTFVVVRVVDGDTLELGNGQDVRLVGIDTPEVGECGYDQASAALSRMVLGKRVTLTRSDEDRDHYGRLLRYVDLGRDDAGLRQIKRGLAIARYDSRDGYGFHVRVPRYVAADRASKNFSCRRQQAAPQAPSETDYARATSISRPAVSMSPLPISCMIPRGGNTSVRMPTRNSSCPRSLTTSSRSSSASLTS